MKNLAFILFGVLTACSGKRLGTCDEKQQVTFRDISFQFPITAYDALRYPGKIVSGQNEFVQTDSIMKNISASWFYESRENKYYETDTINHLKDAMIYGVTFMLWAERNKTDAQIIKELQKNYPGDYEYVDQYASQYYINRRGCLTIIVKREPLYDKPVPSVSFCYGFSDMQGEYFGHITGNWFGFD